MNTMISFLATATFALAVAGATTGSPSVIWFDEPATHFTRSLPLGNGRLGAMVFGGVDVERIVLNENSVWSGSRQDADRNAAHESLPEIRRLLLEGKNVEAEALVNRHFTCQGSGSGHGSGANVPFGCYQVLGNLHLRFDDVESPGDSPASELSGVTDYRRTLDLAAAAARLEFARNGVRFRREHFISAPDEVFVSRLTADRPGSLSFAVGLDRPERFATAVSGTHELLMTGTLNDGRGGRGVTSVARLRVLARGGSVTERANELVIAKADEVILLLAGATDYRGFAGRGVGDPVVATRGDLDRAAAKDYSALEAAHAADYQKWFNRVLLELPGTANSGLPTDDRLRGFAGGAADPALARLYFDFGRIPCVGLSDSPGIRFVLRR